MMDNQSKRKTEGRLLRMAIKKFSQENCINCAYRDFPLGECPHFEPSKKNPWWCKGWEPDEGASGEY